MRGIFAQIYTNEHTERRICQFIVPISSTNPIGFGMQNGTNCNTNGGNTQHHFVELRGIGHDKSGPYAYGINVEIYTNEHTVWRICQFIVPYHNQKTIGFNVRNMAHLRHQ